jgi:hypothetical protein
VEDYVNRFPEQCPHLAADAPIEGSAMVIEDLRQPIAIPVATMLPALVMAADAVAAMPTCPAPTGCSTRSNGTRREAV